MPATTKISACNALPGELLVGILERAPVPMLVKRCRDDVMFLNAQARSLWPTTDAHSSNLPVMVDGKPQSLLTLLTVPTDGVGPMAIPHVRVPVGDEYEVDTYAWESAADSGQWSVAILRPVDHGATGGGLLRNKVDRLKAIVHEFRNTLTAAREALALLQEGVVGELNPEQRRFLNSAVEDLEHLIRAMVDLTSLWVTQAGVLRVVLHPVDIRHVVEQTTLSIQSVAEKRDILLHVEIGDPPPILTGDHELLVQALRNVLNNALHYTSAGGEIRVRAFLLDSPKVAVLSAGSGSDARQLRGSDTDESVVIEVHDSGMGIEPPDQERVFQPFERGNKTGCDKGSLGGGGMGLGLTIARDIAWTHGGTLHVRSAPGMGSCFVFRFPKSETCARSWMVRATQRAIDDVRPLRAPLAGVLLHFETVHCDSGEPNLLSAVQQLAFQNLRPTDTVLAIERRLLLLMRGGTRSAAYALLDRVLHSLAEMPGKSGATCGECSMRFGVAAYPEDGDSADTILERAESELFAFPAGTDPWNKGKP